MKKIAAMLRVKNESRWIVEVLRAARDITEDVYVFDDHSTDGTADLAKMIPSVWCADSPFEGVDEARDKDFLLDQVMKDCNPDWIICIDGDEVLMPDSGKLIERAIRTGCSDAFGFQVIYLWDTPGQIRIDGIYGRFFRPSLFNTRYGGPLTFRRTRFGANFHCSNVPGPLTTDWDRCPVRLKHYGYMDREQRIRKWQWYNSLDPGNDAEDRYRHVVQGDLPEFPIDAKLLHAGPLQLEPWNL